ncbi:2'-5' RNA ligase family protein [Mammaliicoccus fleurettii]|uniref:2'-5' RNA ligase family protein n=1 Tax=Mammaliicoccus fleurettii TaxID=150056 RepID=UPI0009939C71|nr:2'-5' RNA ligase family protein [Mammaliicoccus fleurettii]OOV77253.1 hypothetical protein B2G86_06465 [Mammaliicoccus fleurettii]
MYFIGIVPSEEIYIELSNIQEQYMNKIGVEPHVTLKAQSQLNESQECLKQIEDIISETKQFYITPKTIEFFGEQVLYLSLYSPELIKLHNQLVDILKVPKELKEYYFEGGLFVPHITIGKTTYFNNISTGNNYRTLLEIKKELQDKKTFNSFLVEKVYLYKYIDQKYERIKTLYLKNL